MAIDNIDAARAKFPDMTIVINGNVGPKDDAYHPKDFMTAEEAEAYHEPQIKHLAEETACDIVFALTHSYAEEAIGIARNCKKLAYLVS